MRHAKFTTLPDHTFGPDRRSPAPLSAVSANDGGAEADPTLEIRTLIEQLQHAAREARAAVRETEQERDDLGSQLERALLQVDELRANERELRSHFTEISTILRERDAAIATADRHSYSATRAQEELIGALRQRDEAQRQREEALQRLEALARANTESGTRHAEVQRQLATIRQARDSAHAQILELSDRASRLEDQIAELGYQRDAVKKAQRHAETETEEYRRQLGAMTARRDEEARQVKALTAELDEQRRKLLDLAEQKSAVLQAGSDHAAALAEARAQVENLAHERDAARLVEQAQAREIETIRAQFQSFREHDSQAAGEELAAAVEKLTTLEAQARQSRHDARDLRQQLLAMQEKVATLEVMAEDARAQREELELRCAAATERGEAARHELQLARTAAEEERTGFEAQLLAVRAQGRVPGAAEEGPGVQELQRRFEKQRLQTIDLAAQLQSSQHQIREMSASLAEARLQIKFAAGAAQRRAGVEGAGEPAAPGSGASLAELLPAVRESFAAFSERPAETSRLLTLHGGIVSFTERARLRNCVALHRLARAFAGLLEALAAAPDQVNASTLHTIGQTIEFLSVISQEGAPERFRDPAHSRIYVVDDDEDSCQCVQLVMQEQMIQTSGSQDPSAALLELASETYDLIFLDVNMPHMNGFELCQRLRCLSLHAETPVVFLTGVATEEKREQSILSGGNDFLGKPFNLYEITVKALVLILQRQLVAG